MIAGALQIQMELEMAKISDQLRSVDKLVRTHMDSIRDAAGMATKALGLIGVGLSAGAMVSFVQHAIDAADELNKLSQRTGIAADQLSALQFAAKLSDVSTDSLAGAMKKLNVSISEGLAGDKAKVEVFRNLGISLKDTSGHTLTADQALLKIANSFSGARDGATKVAYAVALMGKAGDEMIPLLNGGGSAIQDLMDKARRMGIVIGPDFAQQAEAFNDNMSILKASGDRLAVTMGGSVVEAFGSIAKAMADAAEQGGRLKGIQAGLNEFGNKAFDWEGNNQRKVITRMRGEIEDAKKQMDEVSTIWSALSSLQKQGAPEIGVGVEDATRKFLQLQDALKKVLEQYYKLTDVAGAGRGVVNPRLLGPVPSMEQQQKELKPLTGGGPKEISEFEKLLARMKERADLTQQELAKGRELTEFEKFATKTTSEAADAKNKLTTAQKALVAKKLEDLAVTDLQLQQQRSEIEAAKAIALARQTARNADYQQSATALQDITGAWAQDLKALNDRLKSLQDERDATLLAAQANITLAEAVERVALARLQDRQGRMVAGGDGYKALQQQIDAQRGIADAVKQAEDTRVMMDLREDFRGALAGGLMQGFSDGGNPAKAFAQNFAQMLYSQVSRKLADAITDALLGTKGQTAAGGGFGGLLGGLLGGSGSLQGAFSQTSLGSSGFGTGMAYGNMDMGLFLHSGGVAGAGGVHRSMPSALFAGAPRFHGGGLASDEIPAVLLRGERVLNRQQTRDYDSGAGSGGPVTVVQNLTVGDVASTAMVRNSMRMAQRQNVAAIQRAQKYGK